MMLRQLATCMKKNKLGLYTTAHTQKQIIGGLCIIKQSKAIGKIAKLNLTEMKNIYTSNCAQKLTGKSQSRRYMQPLI